MEVDERHLALHREPQPDILTVTGISASVAISQQPVGAKNVFVRPFFAFDNRNGRDAEWHFWQDLRFENTLRCD
jgi:hypothetical protein